MARNGSGSYSNPYPNFINGTVISSDQADANNAAIATALTQSIAVDGQTTITANLPMNSKKFTGLAVGTAATDSLTLGQAQAQAFAWGGTAGGGADAITIAPTPAITAYAVGQKFFWIASGSANTGAATIAISGLTAIAMQDGGAALAAGVHAAGKVFMGVLNTTSTVQIMQVQSSGDPLTISALTVNGTSQFSGAIIQGVDGTGYDAKFFGDTSGAYLMWDQSADKLLTAGGALIDIVKDKLMIGGTAVTTTAAELNFNDTATAGTVVAGKTVVASADKDIASFRNITLTGELDAGSLDVSGAVDIDGTTNLDAVDIDGNVQLDGTLTVGVDGTGYDVKLFGDTSGAHVLWDQSEDKLLTAGGALVDVVKDKLMIGGTAVTTTAAELNFNDTATAGTVVASKTVVASADKDIASFRNITLTGELDAGSLDISGIADIAGTTTVVALTASGVVTANANIDLNGTELILDADADTSITADTDDTIDIRIAGADDFQFTANDFTALSGSVISTNTIAETTGASGVTIDGLLIKDGAIPSLPVAGGKNLILNGEVAVSQRGTVTGLGATSGYGPDRWKYESSGAPTGRCSLSQGTGILGAASSLRVDVTTADSSLAAPALYQITQKIEARDLHFLEYGAATAKTMTYSFTAKTNFSGSMTLHLIAADGSRNYATEIDLTGDQSQETFAFVIPGDASGAFNFDTGVGLDVMFTLAAGSAFTGGTEDAWAASNNNMYGASNSGNFFSSTSTFIEFSLMQLEVGSAATAYEHESYGTTLHKVKRYFERTMYAAGVMGVGVAGSTTVFYWDHYYEVEKRAVPTVTLTGQVYSALSGSGFSTGEVIAEATVNVVRIAATISSGLTAGNAILVNASGAVPIDASAEN